MDGYEAAHAAAVRDLGDAWCRVLASGPCPDCGGSVPSQDDLDLFGEPDVQTGHRAGCHLAEGMRRVP